MPDDVRIELRGIRELQRAFKSVDSGMKSALKEEFLGIARKVASTAQGKVPGSGRAAGSIRPKASNRGAQIAFGGSKAPHYPWLDFGGSVGRGHVPGRGGSGSIKRDWKGSPVGSGRYVYPAIAEHGDSIKGDVDEAIERLAKRAGFETRGSN